MFISVATKQYRFDDESYEGTNTEDPNVDFEWVANRAENEEDEDTSFPPKLERMVAQEVRVIEAIPESNKH